MRFTAVLVAVLWGCQPAAAMPVGTTPSTMPLCESIEAQCASCGGTASPYLALSLLAAIPAVVLLVSVLTQER